MESTHIDDLVKRLVEKVVTEEKQMVYAYIFKFYLLLNYNKERSSKTG